MALPLLAPPYTLAGCRTAKERVEALMDLWFGDEFSSLITQFSPLKTQLIECMDVHCTLQNYALVLETALKTPHVTFSASYQTRWEGLKEWILRESNRVEAVVIELRKAMQSVFEQTERSLSTLATYESVNLTSEFNTFASHGFWNLGYLTDLRLVLSHFEVLELYCKVWTTYSTVTTTNLFKLLQDQCTNAKTDAQLELQLESIQFLEEQRERFSEDAFAVSEIDLQLRMAEARHIELSSMVDSKTAALDPKAALTEAQQQLQYLMDNKSLIVKDATVMQMFTLTLEVERVWLQNVECRLMSSSSLEFAVPAPTPEETTTTTTTTVLSGGKRGIDDDVTPPSKGQTVLRHPKAGDVFVYKRAGGVLNGIISARRHVVKRGCKYEYHEIMDAVFESGSVVRVQPTLETISGYLMQKASSVSVIGNAVFVKDVAESGLQEWKFTAV